METLRKRGKQLLIGAGIVVVILLMADFNNRMSELHRLTLQREQAFAEGTAQMSTQFTLQTEIAYATSEAAVEEWAYKEGRMALEGDHAVHLLPAEGELVTPTPVSSTRPTPVENWELWLALFFDR